MRLFRPKPAPRDERDPDRELVAVKAFRNRLEAELAQNLLAVHGIPSFVSAEDAGGMRPPPFSFAAGVQLIVRSLDLIPARRVLKATLDAALDTALDAEPHLPRSSRPA